MSKQDNTERNEAIVAAVTSGTKVAEVAAQFGVSPSTVRKVVNAAGSPQEAPAEEAVMTEAEVAAANAAIEALDKADAERAETPAQEEAKAKVADARTKLTIKKVLAWNEKWTDEDRAAISDAIGQVEGVAFFLPPSEAYVRVERADGTNPLEVSKSRIRYRGDAAEGMTLDGTGWANVALSTGRKASA